MAISVDFTVGECAWAYLEGLEKPDDELHQHGDEEDEAPGQLLGGPLIAQRLEQVSQETPEGARLRIGDEVCSASTRRLGRCKSVGRLNRRNLTPSEPQASSSWDGNARKAKV